MSTTATYGYALDNRRHLHVTQARWFAVRTPFKKEKSAMAELKRRGIECYVPLVEKVKRTYALQ